MSSKDAIMKRVEISDEQRKFDNPKIITANMA